MSDVDDVLAAADHVNALLPHDAPALPVESGWGSVRDRLDSATREQLFALARGGVGEPSTTTEATLVCAPGNNGSAAAHMGPDCAAQKHAACRGEAWCFIEDAPDSCDCPCHL